MHRETTLPNICLCVESNRAGLAFSFPTSLPTLACGGTSLQKCSTISDRSSSWCSRYGHILLTPVSVLRFVAGTRGHLLHSTHYQVPVSLSLSVVVRAVLTTPRHDPLYAAFLLVGSTAAFKSYPTLADPGLFLSMTLLFPEIHSCESICIPHSVTLNLL